MSADEDTAELVLQVAAELSARAVVCHACGAETPCPPSPSTLGAIRGLLLDAWERGGLAADPSTVPYAHSPLPRGV